jgi:hypothetical protein
MGWNRSPDGVCPPPDPISQLFKNPAELVAAHLPFSWVLASSSTWPMTFLIIANSASRGENDIETDIKHLRFGSRNQSMASKKQVVSSSAKKIDFDLKYLIVKGF